MSKQIPLFKVFMSEEAPLEASKVLQSGYIGQGPIVEKFEYSLKNFFGNQNLVTTNSATSAEHLILHMLRKENREMIGEKHLYTWPGINEEDEILTSPLTCTATNWPIILNNYKIKWVDVEPNSCNIDLKDLERKISIKTKIIVLVHWGGNPVDLDKLSIILDKSEKKFGFRPVVIEDCAHAFGSIYNNALIGTHGNFTTFSFQAIKHLTSVDGGCMILPNECFVKRAKLLRWYGIDREQNRKDFRCEEDVSEAGFKMHLNDVNAAVGLANLNHVINKVIPLHRNNASFYKERLADFGGINLSKEIENSESSYWLFTLFVEEQQKFIECLTKQGIQVSRVHERNDIHSCVDQYKTDLPGVNRAVSKMVCIPVGWWVSEEDRNYIVDTIKSGWI